MVQGRWGTRAAYCTTQRSVSATGADAGAGAATGLGPGRVGGGARTALQPSSPVGLAGRAPAACGSGAVLLDRPSMARVDDGVPAAGLARRGGGLGAGDADPTTVCARKRVCSSISDNRCTYIQETREWQQENKRARERQTKNNVSGAPRVASIASERAVSLSLSVCDGGRNGTWAIYETA
jgi:hypothetical protein